MKARARLAFVFRGEDFIFRDKIEEVGGAVEGLEEGICICMRGTEIGAPVEVTFVWDLIEVASVEREAARPRTASKFLLLLNMTPNISTNDLGGQERKCQSERDNKEI